MRAVTTWGQCPRGRPKGFGGARGESPESSFSLAKRFRELAGFTDDEVETISQMDAEALEERKEAVRKYRERVGADV